MRKLTMAIGALLSGTLALSPFAATAFAAESKTLNITASSNFSPSVTQSIDSATKQITTTWWLQDAEDKMVNIQGILTYDNTKLSVDMSDGVNRTYDAENDEYIDNILCITNGKSTVVNYNPKSLPDGSNAGIRFNATEASGFSMGSATEKVPFFSVTFNPIDDAQGDTDVHLEVNYMAIRDENDTTYHKLIHKSEIVDKDAVYLPEEHAAIYEGPFDPNYTPAEPTTAEPTTVEPTTAEPTTAEPTTAAPTTVAPTTVAPTTIAPTTVAPTTIAPSSYNDCSHNHCSHNHCSHNHCSHHHCSHNHCSHNCRSHNCRSHNHSTHDHCSYDHCSYDSCSYYGTGSCLYPWRC